MGQLWNIDLLSWPSCTGGKGPSALTPRKAEKAEETEETEETEKTKEQDDEAWQQSEWLQSDGIHKLHLKTQPSSFSRSFPLIKVVRNFHRRVPNFRHVPSSFLTQLSGGGWQSGERSWKRGKGCLDQKPCCVQKRKPMSSEGPSYHHQSNRA